MITLLVRKCGLVERHYRGAVVATPAKASQAGFFKVCGDESNNGTHLSPPQRTCTDHISQLMSAAFSKYKIHYSELRRPQGGRSAKPPVSKAVSRATVEGIVGHRFSGDQSDQFTNFIGNTRRLVSR